tara:strand:- start:59 stop:163 length:105 start_codon:yes stop_codon:yes gene_type:complete
MMLETQHEFFFLIPKLPNASEILSEISSLNADLI